MSLKYHDVIGKMWHWYLW